MGGSGFDVDIAVLPRCKCKYSTLSAHSGLECVLGPVSGTSMVKEDGILVWSHVCSVPTRRKRSGCWLRSGVDTVLSHSKCTWAETQQKALSRLELKDYDPAPMSDLSFASFWVRY